MITMNTLANLMNRYKEILRSAESFGYVNLKLFCSYNKGDKHRLNFLANSDHNKRQAITYDQDINGILSDLLETEVCLWSEGATGLKVSDYVEAAKTPLSDIEKTINYFINILIPYSTDEETIGQSHNSTWQYWQQVPYATFFNPQAAASNTNVSIEKLFQGFQTREQAEFRPTNQIQPDPDLDEVMVDLFDDPQVDEENSSSSDEGGYYESSTP